MKKSLLILPLVLAATAAHAFSAVAIGTTGNIAQAGLAIGIARGYASTEIAEANALATCRSYPSAPIAASYCRIVGHFDGEFFVFAEDEAAGTPGYGWAISTSLEEATTQALQACYLTAGLARQQFCVLDGTYADGVK